MRASATAEEPAATTAPERDAEPVAVALEDHLPGPEAVRELDAGPFARLGTRMATPTRRQGRHVHVRVRGFEDEIAVAVDPEVDAQVIDDAIAAGDGVLVETTATEGSLVVGVVVRRVPSHRVVRAERITVEAEDEVLLRAGTSALRLRADGDVEVVGSRISATSRGLFRLVGRLLRLN